MSGGTGYGVIPKWLLSSREFNASTKVVYAVLAWRTGEDGICFPSEERIADDSGQSVPTVKRSIRALKSAGLLTVMVERTSRGRRNHYRLQHDRFGGAGVGSE